MKHKEGNFQGLKNTSIYYQNWASDESKAVVIIVHGFGEHSGRYGNVVDLLVPAGYSVWALDHRGHGKSEGKRNHVGRFTDYMEDLRLFEEIVRAENADLPTHIIGHSMGSIIVNNYMAKYADQTKFRSMVLSGTGAAPGPEISGGTILLSKIFSFILPKISIPSNLDPNFISHDQAVIDAYINDPLVLYDKITPRLGAELFKYLLMMKDAATMVDIPVLMQIGSEDASFHQDSWKPLFDSFKSTNKIFNIYDGYRHEVYNEVEKKPLTDLKEWLDNNS